jgi:Arc/MetJ-type ribon-helix-helix transcriptional regulator
MTIHLPEDVESSIRAAVHSGRYASLDDAMTEAAALLLERLKQEQSQAVQPAASQPLTVPADKPLWQKFEEIAAGIPKEVWDKIPADSSEQLDHYLYATPRRPAR